MGNEQAKASSKAAEPPKDEGFITVLQQYDKETDPILVQLENAPMFARPILETNARRFVIDSWSIEDMLERIQELLALSSRAAANEQRVLNGSLRMLEGRVNEIYHLQAATTQLEKSATNLKTKLDELDQYLNQLQR